MLNSKEADFILRGDGEVIYPEISKDGLEVYYDVKGKKNGDVHKDKLLDMSGQGKDGVLSGFDYDGELSGYDGDNGLVFDGIDDKLVLGDVEKPEIVSATRNLFNITKTTPYNMPSVIKDGDWYVANSGSWGGIIFDKFKTIEGKTYTISFTYKSSDNTGAYTISNNLGKALPALYGSNRSMGLTRDGKEHRHSITFTATNTEEISISLLRFEGTGSISYKDIQLEEGSTATPYVPYIPTAKMTYQLNNNVISYGEGGMVKWVKDGEVAEVNGNMFSVYDFIRNNKENGYLTIEPSLSDGGLAYTSFNIAKNHLQPKYLQGSFEENTEYTLSFKLDFIRDEHPSTSYYFELNYTDGSMDYIIVNLSRQNKLISFTSDGSKTLDFITTSRQYNGDVIVYQVKLEKGSRATQWLPNPMDLLEANELKGNILGDMEDIVDASPRDSQSGKEVFTEHADDSHVHVEVDGQSYQEGSNILKLTELRSYSAYNTTPSVDSNGRVSTTYTSNINYLTISGGGIKLNARYSISGFFKLNGVPIKSSQWFSKKTDTGAVVEKFEVDDSTGYLESVMDWTSSNSTWLFHTPISGTTNGAVVTIDSFSVVPLEPTPEYPIEIHSLNDFDVVSSVGTRNIALNSGRDFTHNTTIELSDDIFDIGSSEMVMSFDVLSDGVMYTGDRNRYRAGFEVTLTHEDGGTSYFGGWYNFKEGEKINKRFIVNRTVRDSKVIGYSNPMVHFQDIDNVKVSNLRVSLKGGSLEYIPAPEEITENDNHPLIDKINLNLDEPLRSVGDVHDRLFKDSDNLWKVERNIGENILDSSNSMTNFGYSSYDTDVKTNRSFTPSAPHNGRSNEARTTHFVRYEGSSVWAQPNGIGYNLNANNQFHISFPNSLLGVSATDSTSTRNNKIREWLDSEKNKGTPLTIQYTLRTSKIETLSQNLQDKLNSLRSFQDSNYVYTVQNTDSPHKEQLKPTLHATFNSKDYLKETRTLTNLLIWARELTDEELIHHNQLFLNRFNLPSDGVVGEPIEQTLSLLHGGMVGHSLEQNYTINI